MTPQISPSTRLIAIAGGSGAGKSALVHRLARSVEEACVIDLDAYYLDRGHLPRRERAGLNYDEPRAFDLPLLVEHLSRLARGEAVAKPRYSFTSHTRVGQDWVAPAPLILVEGLFALWWPELRALMELKVFVDAPADLRLLRRVQRDVVERGRTVAAVAEQYLGTVRPMHERYVEPTRAYADLIIENGSALEECVDRTLIALRQLLAPASAGR